MIRLNNVSKYLTILLVLIAWLPAQAQDQNPNLQRELTLEKEYSPSLRDANKINRLPDVKEPEAPQTRVEFSNYTLDYPGSPYFQKIGVINYFPGFADSDKRGYLNAGLSNLLNINGDLGYQILQSATDRLSVFGSHRSSNSRVPYLQNDEKRKMKINDNCLGLDIKHYFKKATLSADAQYTLSSFNYYGFPATDQVMPVFDFILPIYSDNQENNLLKIHTGIRSAETQKLSYRLNFGYTSFKQKQAGFAALPGKTENRMLFDIGLHAQIHATAGIGMDGAVKGYAYRLPEDIKYAFLDENMGNYNYTTGIINPYLTFEGGSWDARLGVKADIQWGGIKNFVPSPDIRFRWRPSDPVLLYLTAEGGIKDNSAYTMYYENRYVDPLYRVYDSKSPFDGSLGIVFSPVGDVSVDVFAGYKWVNDEHFYFAEPYDTDVSDADNLGQKILPQYAAAKTFKLGGSVKYQYQNLFDLSLKLVYNQWNITKISEEINTNPFSEQKPVAWNKPVFTGDGNMGFKIPSLPFRVDLAYHLETGRKALQGVETVSMKDIHDLSAAATFTISKSLSVFAKANNLLFQKYDFWQGYPAQGFNIMGGISWKF